MAEKSCGFVSTADSPSSNYLNHLDFGSNSDPSFLLLDHPNIEPICGYNSEEVMIALFRHPSSACAMAAKSDGSAPARDYRSGDPRLTNRLLKSLQVSFFIAALTKAVRDAQSAWDLLRGPADGGNEGIVEWKNDEAIGIDASTPSSTRRNVVEIEDEGNLEKDKSSQVLVQTNPMPPIPLNDKRKSRACALALGSIDRVVAHDYMHEEGDSNLLHGSVFSKENARVSIDSLERAEYGSEHLLIPTPDAETLMEAVKGFVAWPRHLVILKTSVAQEKAPLKQGNFDIVVKSFAKLVDKATKQTPSAAIYVMVDREVFRPGGRVSDIPVFRDELLDLINFKEIGVTIMKLYMCALSNKAKEVGVDRTIRFAAPAGLRGYTETDNIDQLHDTLETAESEQYFLYPYNIGFHWVLAIIDPQERHTLYLDPLDNEVDVNIVEILSYACKSLDYNKKFNASKKNATFEKVTCPKQPESVECGYYVMRYMKDVIDSHGIHPAKVFHNNECYRREMIDEVRIELMNFIRDNM